MCVSHLRNGTLIHCVSSQLLVNVEQSIQIAGPPVQQLIRHVRVRTEHRALQLEEPARQKKKCLKLYVALDIFGLWTCRKQRAKLTSAQLLPSLMYCLEQSSPTHVPGETVFTVSGVVQFVVDHCAHCQRPRVTTQERHFATIEDPHGPLHIVQSPLQVGGLVGHAVQLQVQQSDTCRGKGAHTVQ